MTTTTRAPFRAEHVGSLLRPPSLKSARAQREAGAITAAQLREEEDRAVREVIAKQESLGLQVVTDGEFRRAFWHLDFLGGLNGVEIHESGQGIQFQGGQTKAKAIRVTGKIEPGPHYMLDHWKFAAAHTRETAKVMIPSPTVLHYRAGRAGVDPAVYPSLEECFHDLARAYRRVIRDHADAGCSYLQLDDVNFAYLCDENQRQMLRDRGDDPGKLPTVYADLVNASLAGHPDGMCIGMHLCRGNFKSMWIAEGGYEPVADLLFNQVHVDAYFLEWDSDRAGGFEPLRFVPKGKWVVLGIVTSKTGEVETKDHIRRRLDEAARYIDLDQVCISPQCGFASTEEGNTLTEDQQWAKLRTVVEVAEAVWG